MLAVMSTATTIRPRRVNRPLVRTGRAPVSWGRASGDPATTGHAIGSKRGVSGDLDPPRRPTPGTAPLCVTGGRTTGTGAAAGRAASIVPAGGRGPIVPAAP